MSDTAWGFVALGGLLLVVAANLLRYRRTSDRGCLGHLFVAGDQLSAPEWALNRTGIVAFAAGVVLSIAL